MNLSQKIAINTIVQFVGRIFTAASSLIITMAISWKLGAEGLGQYTRIVSYVTIWFVLLDFGINPIAVKAVSKLTEKEDVKKALRENYKMLLGLRTVVTLLILVVATGILFLLPDDTYTPLIRKAIIVAYIQILGQSIVSSSMPVFQITLSYFWATLSNLIGSLISLGLVVYAILSGGGVFEIVLASMGGWLVIALLTYYFATRETGFVLPEFEPGKWIKILKQALPVGIALLFNVVFVKLNMQLLQILDIRQEVLDKYGSIDAQTGFYGLALRFFDIIITIPFFFSNAIYPTLVQRREKSLESLRRFMNKALDVIAMVGFPISAGGVVLAHQIIYYVSGGFLPNANPDEFIPAIPALQILIFGAGLFFTTGVITWTPIIMNKQWVLPKLYGIVLLITIIANIILVPNYGYLGAAVITIIGEFGAFFLHLYYARKLIDFKYDFLFVLKAIIASTVMGGIMYPFRDMFILIPAVIGIVAYLVLGSATGVVDTKLIKSVLRR